MSTVIQKIALRIIIFLWIIFSLVYIFHDIWSDFKLRQLTQAYQQGKADTINELLRQAEKCDPFSVFSGEKQVQLINVDCLKTSEK